MRTLCLALSVYLVLLTERTLGRKSEHPLLAGVKIDVNEVQETIRTAIISPPLFVNNDTGRCEKKKLNSCIRSFAEDIGYKSRLPINPTAFSRHLESLYRTQGPIGFRKICQSAYLLRSCLSDSLDSCMSLPFLVRDVGLNAQTSALYVGLSNKLMYQCGEAHDYILTYWDCIHGSKQNYSEELERCLPKSIKDPCKYKQSSLHCYGRVISKHCGKVAGKVACESIQRTVNPLMDQSCSLTCPNHHKKHIIKKLNAAQKWPEKRHPPVLPKQIPNLNEADIPTPHCHGHCNKRIFSRCIGKYFKNLGFPIPRNASEYMYDLGSLVSKGKQGFTKVCRAAHTLGKCLGRERKACFDVKNLMDMGISIHDALSYHTIADTMAYECGPAYKTILNKYDCILREGEKAQATEMKCYKEFVHRIKQHPERKCMYVQVLVDCTLKPFRKACGKHISHVMCEADKIAMHTSLPKCHLRCDRHKPSDDSTTPAPISTSSALIEQKPKKGLFSHSMDIILNKKDLHWTFNNNEKKTCNFQKYGKCMEDYMKASQLSPNSIQDFLVKAERAVFKDGRKALSTICRAFNGLRRCMGDDEKACFNVDTIEKVTGDRENTIIGLAAYAEFEILCGSEYQTVYDNFDCVLQTAQKYNETIKHCVADLERFIAHDPPRTCHFVQEFIMCASKPFKDHCSAKVGEAICNVERGCVDTVWAQCHLTCTPHHTHHFLPQHSVYQKHSHIQEIVPAVPLICERKFEESIRRLASILGFHKIPKNSLDFAEHIHKWLMNRDLIEERFDRLCRGFNQFSSTLNGKEKECLSYDFLRRRGVSKADSLNFQIMDEEYGFLCGSGREVFENNLHCIQHVSTAQQPMLRNCSINFQDSLVKKFRGVDNSNRCTIIHQFLKCWVSPFINECDSDVAIALCKTMKIGMENHYPTCSINCAVDIFESW